MLMFVELLPCAAMLLALDVLLMFFVSLYGARR